MIFDRAPEFSRELKTLAKRWRTLEADLKVAESALTQVYESAEVPSRDMMLQAFFDGKRAARLVQSDHFEVVKMRLDCSSPGAGGKLRLVFVYMRSGATVTFIEIYAKNDKAREDSVRISQYTAGL